MKLLYFKQPKSNLSPQCTNGTVIRKLLKSENQCDLYCVYNRSSVFFPEGEYAVYHYHKKNIFSKDDYTYFVNLGDFGLYINYLMSLKNEYTIESILKQIKGINLREFVKKGYIKSMQKDCYVRSKGAMLYIESNEVGKYHLGSNEEFELPFYSEALIKEIPYEFIDTSKLEKLNTQPYTDSKGMPDWAKFCIKAGVKIGVAMIAGYFGSQIDVPDIFDSTDMSYDTNLCDFETNDMFDGFELGISDSNDFDCTIDYSNVSFGQKVHVEQIGGGLGEGIIDLDKKPGTSHTWLVKKSGKIIAEITSLSSTFYVPGIGTCKIS